MSTPLLKLYNYTAFTNVALDCYLRPYGTDAKYRKEYLEAMAKQNADRDRVRVGLGVNHAMRLPRHPPRHPHRFIHRVLDSCCLRYVATA